MIASIVYTRNNIRIIITNKEDVDMIYNMNDYYIVFNSNSHHNIYSIEDPNFFQYDEYPKYPYHSEEYYNEYFYKNLEKYKEMKKINNIITDKISEIVYNITNEKYDYSERYPNYYSLFFTISNKKEIDNMSHYYGYFNKLNYEYKIFDNVKIHNRVYVSNDMIEEDLLIESRFWEACSKINITEYCNILQFNNDNMIITDDDYTYVDLLHPHGWYCFGEFLDTFGKVFILDKYRKVFDFSKIKLVLYNHTRVTQFKDYFYKLGFTEDNFFFIRKEDKYFFKQLLFIPNLNFPTHITDYLKLWMTKHFVTNFDMNKKYYLYLSRNKYGVRCVENDDIVCTYLKSNGFTILYGNETLDQMIDYFAHAEVIIYPHGSLIRNLVFCKKRPLIYEFCSKNRVNKSFLGIALASMIPSGCIYVDSDKHNNIVIDMKILENIVSKIN